MKKNLIRVLVAISVFGALNAVKCNGCFNQSNVAYASQVNEGNSVYHYSVYSSDTDSGHYEYGETAVIDKANPALKVTLTRWGDEGSFDVLIDGVYVRNYNYSLSSAVNIQYDQYLDALTFSSEYLKRLDYGKHTLTIESDSTNGNVYSSSMNIYVSNEAEIRANIPGADAMISRIKIGEGTLNDYTSLSINNVTDLTLEDVNWYMKKSNIRNLGEITIYSEEILNTLNRINSGNATESYYSKLGIDCVKKSNISYVNEAILNAKNEKGANLTRAEIERQASTTVTNLENNENYILSKIQFGEGTLEDYRHFGITCITEDTLEDARWINSASSYKNETVSQINTACNDLVNALNEINKGVEQLRINRYKVLGIESVTESNCIYVKSKILEGKVEKGSNLTRTEIIAVVDESVEYVENALAIIREGNATLDIYKELNIKGVTENNLEDVNWGEKKVQPGTIAKARSSSENTINALKSVNAGYKYTSYYIYLGMDYVNEENVVYVKDEMMAEKRRKGADLTRTEMLEVAAPVAEKVNDAFERAKSGEGTKEDYELFKVTKITSDNLEDVNWYVSTCNASTISNIKSSANKMITALSYINKGTTTISYYKTLGITSVTSSNAKQVKTAILAERSANRKDLNRDQIIEVVDRIVSAN